MCDISDKFFEEMCPNFQQITGKVVLMLKSLLTEIPSNNIVRPAYPSFFSWNYCPILSTEVISRLIEE